MNVSYPNPTRVKESIRENRRRQVTIRAPLYETQKNPTTTTMKKKAENKGLSIRDIQRRIGYSRWRIERAIETNAIQPVRTKGRAKYYRMEEVRETFLQTIRELLDKRA